MNPQEMEEKAEALFGDLYHCSQAVLVVGQEKLNGRVSAELTRAMDAFGGGLGGHGETCGALVGALAVIGLMDGRSTGGQYPEMKMWMHARELVKRFRMEIAGGHILCRDIAAVDWTDPDQVKAYRGGPKREICRKLTGRTARLVGEIIERAGASK
jgi:C_GCAxxG_C_C family probable redox protein